MVADRSGTEEILSVLHPYASHWLGTLSRGHLVIIPQRRISRMINEIIDNTRDTSGGLQEASALGLFPSLSELRRLPRVQDKIDRLKPDFQNSKK